MSLLTTDYQNPSVPIRAWRIARFEVENVFIVGYACVSGLWRLIGIVYPFVKGILKEMINL